MARMSTEPSQNYKDTAKGGARLFVELGPALSFIVAYNLARRLDGANAIYWGTGVFMAATAAALAYAWFAQRRVPLMLIVTGAVVFVFGALTLYLRDPRFAYYKPTIINLLFAGAIFGGLAVKRNVWRLMFEQAFQLPSRIWDVFALRWGAFYVFLAGLNEVIWRTQSETFWANFKFFGVVPLTFLFLLANAPLTAKWIGKSDTDYDAERNSPGSDEKRPD